MKLKSMTGFAAASRTVQGLQVTWEIRTVNHRFLDVGFRLPDEFRPIEQKFRHRVAGVLGRGKVDCSLRVQKDSDAGGDAVLRPKRLASLVELVREARSYAPEAAQPSLTELLRWPGVVEERRPETAALGEAALAALEEALQQLIAARGREGEYLADVLRQRCAKIRTLASDIRPRVGSVEERFRVRLAERLEKIDIEVHPERLEQEVALLLQRLDITEELDRLEGHVREIEDSLKSDEPVGRRLDFLVQELNREANTIASKSGDAQLSGLAVELKVVVEQIREQVQNVE